MSSKLEISGPLLPTRALFGSKAEQIAFALNPEQTVLRWLKRYRAAFVAGDKEALPLAIKICSLMGWPLHKWMVDAFAEACTVVLSAQVASWDDVLRNKTDHIEGPRQLAKARRTASLAANMMALLQANPPAAINDDLWELLAKKLKITKSAAKNLYYKFDKRDLPRPQRKRPLRPK